MNKNNFIFILFVAALLGSTWGAVVNRQKIDLEQQLRDARAELQKVSEQTGGLESPAEKQVQLDKARKELAELRKAKQFLEEKLSASTAAIQVLSGEKESLARQLKSGQGSETAVQEKTAGAAQKSGGEEGLRQHLEEVNAQLLGLEKIVDEKNSDLQEAAAEKERLQINMDVLLAKIADQKRALLAIQEENRELVKQLAARNETADFLEKQPPDRE
jgi:chromosome segregation ATPase